MYSCLLFLISSVSIRSLPFLFFIVPSLHEMFPWELPIFLKISLVFPLFLCIVHLRSLSYLFFGRNDAKAETPVLWPPHAKSWLIGKDSGVGRDWGQEEKGMTENEMAGWHRWLFGCECEWTPGVGDGQGGPRVLRFMGSQRFGHDWVTELNWTEPHSLVQWVWDSVQFCAYAHKLFRVLVLEFHISV